MRTISQVAELTGISTRTLQYYDEIGLLKPSELTESGYRLYDDEVLQKLQQILFFKEQGFKLKEIKEILQKPDFDRIKGEQQAENPDYKTGFLITNRESWTTNGILGLLFTTYPLISPIPMFLSTHIQAIILKA